MLHTTNAIPYQQHHQINYTVKECQLLTLETHNQGDGISQMHNARPPSQPARRY